MPLLQTPWATRNATTRTGDENDGIISSLLEQKRAAFVKIVGDSDTKLGQAHKEICSKVQTELRKMQNNWWSNKADELQNLADRHVNR